MKKPSYKCYERGGLVEFLLETHTKFARGKAGRRATTKAHGLYAFRHTSVAWCNFAYFGPRQDYDLCRDLLFSERHPSRTVKARAKKAVMRRVQDALNTNKKAFFNRLAVSVGAVQKAPFDPLGVALGLAYKEHERIHGPDSEPLPVQLVEKARDFFEVTTGPQFESLRVSLTTKATRLLGNTPTRSTNTGRTARWVGQLQ